MTETKTFPQTGPLFNQEFYDSIKLQPPEKLFNEATRYWETLVGLEKPEDYAKKCWNFCALMSAAFQQRLRERTNDPFYLKMVSVYDRATQEATVESLSALQYLFARECSQEANRPHYSPSGRQVDMKRFYNNEACSHMLVVQRLDEN